MPDHAPEIYKHLEGNITEKNRKSEIYNLAYDEILTIMNSDLKGKDIWGSIFETLVKTELNERRRNVETPQQKLIRELIEDMYENAESIIGTGLIRPSKPDTISVGFENNKLVIKEIIEIKSTAKAYEKAHEKEQPIKSIQTIQKLVKILNQILSETEEDQKKSPNDKLIAESTSLSLDQKKERVQNLNNIRNRLGQIRNKNIETVISAVVYSADLNYSIQIPKGLKINNFSKDYLLTEYDLPVGISLNECSFSKTDIYKIIEFHQEQVGE